MTQTAAGNGQVVGVVADAGTGKSRLCFEFLEQCRARGLEVFEARAVAHGRNVPLLPISELFRAYFGITAQDDDRTAREKIAGRLLLLDQKFADTLALLFDFLGVTDPQRPAPLLDSAGRQRQLLALMRQVIQSAEAGRPTVTLIEDLHWIDAASSEFLEAMVEAQAGSRRLLLVNFRPEYHAEWMQKSWYRQIPLTPLGLAATAELLTDLLGTDPSLANLAAPIHARTGGNPFFTEEVVQSLIESGQLEGQRGRYRLVTKIENLSVPTTVQALLAARIDRSNEREKRVLQIASVIGKDFAEPLLATIAGLPTEDLKASLATLRRAEFIHEQALYPIAEYSFKHPLTQEVALNTQLKERRRERHALVARALEADAEHLDERAALLAQHWEEADEALTAARWHRRAAEWVGRTDIPAGARHWQRVHALLEGLPIDDEIAQLGVAATTRLLSLAYRTGASLAEARTWLEAGREFARAIGDRRIHLTLSLVYSSALLAAGEFAAYRELAHANVTAARELDDLVLQSNAHAWLVWRPLWGGPFSEALSLAEEGLQLFPRQTPREQWVSGINPYTIFSFQRAWVLSVVGRLADAHEEFGRCSRLAEAENALEVLGWLAVLTSEIHYLTYVQDPDLASARRVETITRTLGDPPNMVALMAMLFCYGHLVAVRALDAVAAARTAFELHTHHVEPMHAGWSGTLLADALLAAGDYSAAEAAAQAAIIWCRRSPRPFFETIAHGVLARARLRRDGAAAHDVAAAALNQAAELIDSSSAKALVPALLEWRAELAAVVGDTRGREKLLAEAEQGYAGMGAPKQVERLMLLR